MGSRLSTKYPELDANIRRATDASQKKAAWAAAKWAVDRTELQHSAISSAKVGQPAEDLFLLAEELDNIYFELQERAGSEDDILTAFGRARAASALAFAVEGNAFDAIYEATFCDEDIEELEATILNALTPM